MLWSIWPFQQCSRWERQGCRQRRGQRGRCSAERPRGTCIPKLCHIPWKKSFKEYFDEHDTNKDGNHNKDCNDKNYCNNNNDEMMSSPRGLMLSRKSAWYLHLENNNRIVYYFDKCCSIQELDYITKKRRHSRVKKKKSVALVTFCYFFAYMFSYFPRCVLKCFFKLPASDDA